MLTLVTGGSGSGKSAFAEKMVTAHNEGQRIYIATMYPFDQESEKRIARHRKLRKDKQFQTIECYTNLKAVKVPAHSNILLECMSNLTANEMYQAKGAGTDTVSEVLKGINYLMKLSSHLIIVTNEVFSDGIQYDDNTMKYLSFLGKINQEIGKRADQVIEVVYGIPIWYKGDQRDADLME